jgi:hypothetical protein
MFKFCLPSAIRKLMKCLHNQALSGLSNLVRRYLQIIADFQLFIAEIEVTEKFWRKSQDFVSGRVTVMCFFLGCRFLNP